MTLAGAYFDPAEKKKNRRILKLRPSQPRLRIAVLARNDFVLGDNASIQSLSDRTRIAGH